MPCLIATARLKNGFESGPDFFDQPGNGFEVVRGEKPEDEMAAAELGILGQGLDEVVDGSWRAGSGPLVVIEHVTEGTLRFGRRVSNERLADGDRPFNGGWVASNDFAKAKKGLFPFGNQLARRVLEDRRQSASAVLRNSPWGNIHPGRSDSIRRPKV